MSHILVTGSSTGLGRLAAESLLDDGHDVVVHVRNAARLADVRALLERGAQVVTGDLADTDATRALASEANALGTFDAVIHNAGVDAGPDLVAVNVVAPYVLTAAMRRPGRLVYLSSGMHLGGRPDRAPLDRAASYSDSKLWLTTLAMAVARRWPDVLVNSVCPGWVPTRMGGPDAPDDLTEGHLTQTWLATSHEPAALVSGGYWRHRRPLEPHPATLDEAVQGRLLTALADATGVQLP